MKRKKREKRELKADFSKLDRAFNPKCIAIIGDKGQSNYMWIKSQSNFEGKLYSVQIDPNEIEGIEELGVTNFTNLMDVPEPIDLAIVAVPREITPRILDDLIRKDVAAAHFFTAGFAETDTEKGIELENFLTEKAEQANFHLVGPNCMGIRNPRRGVGQEVEENESPYAGSMGFISQSGMHAGGLIREANLQGLNICKSVSFGNGIVLDSTDYLEYFSHDPGITGIGMYIEGVKDGERFRRVLSEVTSKKPVVIWKGGRSEEGKRVVGSHTGALAGTQRIWEAAVSQCGAVNTYGVEETIDALKALQFLYPVVSEKVGISGGSGGQSTAITDVFIETGLKVPVFDSKSLDKFSGFFSLIGGSYLNPVDTANENRTRMPQILDILEKDANTDSLVVLLSSRTGSGEQFESLVDALSGIRKRAKKPVMAILPVVFSEEDTKRAGETMQRLQNEGIPTFISLERGARALKHAFEYYSLKKRAGS